MSSKSRKSKSSKIPKVTFEQSEHVKNMAKKFFASSDYDSDLMIPEDERISFGWEDICFHADKKSGPPCSSTSNRIDILKKVNGFCPPGSFTAIIGPSGAGKTSLLNILSKKITENVSGSIYVNGNDPDDIPFKKVTGYVAQEDVVMGSLSAEEVLTFTAQLKLPEFMSDDEKDEYVASLLKSIGLYHVKDNLIGYAGTTTGARSGIKRGLSGGERKRVSICLELVSNPKVLFLDEPTSGLDSFAAYTVLRLLRNLAFMGRTIVCTIHQPSTDMVKMFDNLMLLSLGESVYFGPMQEAVPYFDSIGYPCPPFVNPSEFLLRLIQAPPSEAQNEDEEEPSAAAPDLAVFHEEFKESEYLANIKKDLKKVKKSDPGEVSYQHNDSSGFKQFSLLTGRNILNIIREPGLFRVRVMLSIFFSLITGLLWFRLKYNLTDGLERISALFFILTTQLFGGLSGPTQIFANERPVYYRERNSGMYGSFPYYLSKLITEVPLNIFVPMIAASIGYWMINFNDTLENFLYFSLFFVLVANVAHGLGMVLATAFDDPTTATKLQPIILMPLFLFSGFFVNSDNIPVYFSWIEYISFFKYGFRGAAVSVFEGLNITCDYDELTNTTFEFNATIPTEIGGMIVNITTPIVQNISICVIESGDQILSQLSIEPMTSVDIIFLVCNFFVFHLIAFLALSCCKREK